ncbi:aspartic proteinase nepenthesin-1-like [Silene latifolia]|uniref:aspartic proteinase nepenthesin-1-like n=1 Tax=Silene latifolia TaxID=37657 RepID=UPI003D76C98E
MTRLNPTWSPFLVAVLLYALAEMVNTKADVKNGGLHLRMIHIDAPNSPMYQPELTKFERVERLITISNSRMHYLATKTSLQGNWSTFHEQDVTSSQLKLQWFTYYVHVSIGQFHDAGRPYHDNFLALDTGSDVIWTQCEGCRHCFEQRGPYFPKSRSQTYHPFTRYDCPSGSWRGDHCEADISYDDRTRMKGIWAKEMFTFTSPGLSDKSFEDLDFVCAMDTYNFIAGNYHNNIITGVLGMSKGHNSLISQLNDQDGGQFTYCLQDHNDYHGTYSQMFLSFGNYLNRPPVMSVTPILPVLGSQFYYVSLKGISVDGARLNIPPNLFAPRRSNSGGTIFDTGASFSFIVSGAFDILKDAIATYVGLHNHNLRIRGHQNIYNLEACWEPVSGSANAYFPTITFHLQNNADLVVQPKEMFPAFPYPGVPHPGMYCMSAMRAHANLNIIGAYQQINQRVVIDVRRSALSFVATDCSTSTL